VLAAWVLLLLAWVVSNPPFAGPDEEAHYVRALGISEGHLIGKPDPSASIGATPTQIAWTRPATRLVSLPAGLDPAPFGCATGAGKASAECLLAARPIPGEAIVATPVGNYPPLPYLLPAALMRAESTPPGALRVGRAVSAVLALALLTIALLALYDSASPMISLLGLLVAVTPMVLFSASSLNGSGLEISSAIAFFATLLRLSREQGGRRWWIAAAVSGSALVLSRQASPLWLVIAPLPLLAWRGGPLLARWAAQRAAWIATVVLLVALGLALAWAQAYGSQVPLDLHSLHAGLVGGVHEWWRAASNLVGTFGYLDVKLPLFVVLIWFALGAALLLLALRGGTRRERILLGVLLLAAVVLPPIFFALVTRPTGFGLQGRDILPAIVIMPLLAGELCHRNRERLGAALQTLAVAAPVVVAIVQVGAWYVNSKRFAVGDGGPEWFLSAARWSPPLGWVTWLVVVLVAAICLVGLTLATYGEQRRGSRAPRSAVAAG
jgi:hypothetical protein